MTIDDDRSQEVNNATNRIRPLEEERRTVRATIRRPMTALKAAHRANRTRIERLGDALIGITSANPFLIVHVLWFAVWISWNTGLLGFRVFDPFPFGLLTLVVSLEAIFLTILVLISQKRESAVAELREELTFQVILRIEAEVTKNLQLGAGLYTRLGHKYSEDDDLREMLQNLDPEDMERELAEQINRITTRTK